jgi:hypothetical protein
MMKLDDLFKDRGKLLRLLQSGEVMYLVNFKGEIKEVSAETHDVSYILYFANRIFTTREEAEEWAKDDLKLREE